VKDRAFFFVAAERLDQDQESLIDTQGIVPSLDGTTDAVPLIDNLFTAKFTSNLSPTQYLTVRYGQQKTETAYATAPNYAPNARGTLTNTFHSALASHSYVISEDKLNEFTFQYADFKNAIRPTSNDPTEIFPNGVYLGQNINTPQTTEQVKYQFKDDFSFTVGSDHHFKTGIVFVHEPTLGGSFTTGTVPQFTHLGNSQDSLISDIRTNGGVFGDATPNNQTGFYIQDDWNVNQHLTFNLGLRYDIVTGLEIDQSASTLYQALHNSPFDFSWLQPFQDSANGSFENDTNNWQPRLGAAYDVKGDGRTVIRGGWGLYYDFPYTNANLLFPLAALGGFGAIYGNTDADGICNVPRVNGVCPGNNFFHVGDPLPPNQLGGLASAAPNDVLSPDWRVPYTNQVSVGFSQMIGTGGALDVDYVHVAVRDQYIRFKFNGTPETGGPRMLTGFTSAPRIYFTGGSSDYDGVSFTYRHRLTQNFQFQAAYTLSQVEGNLLPGSDEFRLGSPGICTHCSLFFETGPEDDPRMVGPLNTDARHRFVIAGTYNLPWEFVVSGFFRANTAKPFNGFVPEDLNGDGLNYDTTDSHVNEHRGESFSQLDLRIGKFFTIKDRVRIEGIFEVFNLFNATNPGNNNLGGTSYIGDLTDPDFGEATTFAGDPGQGEQRLAQIGFRIEF
jgi:hypothetical protein